MNEKIEYDVQYWHAERWYTCQIFKEENAAVRFRENMDDAISYGKYRVIKITTTKEEIS